MRVIVLGATGMLGQAVSSASHLCKIETLDISRSGPIRWDFFESTFEELASSIDLESDDVIVNCIGWIPQKAAGNPEVDSRNANLLNVELIKQIHRSQVSRNFKWIQIATDCVFSGEEGNYSEVSPLNPVDLYGESKAAGELEMTGAMVIRCSIIGPDTIHRSGLFEWLRSQPSDVHINGFANHMWNGVSTLAFAKLSIELAINNLVSASHQHWVPSDVVSKWTLLKLFQKYLGRSDLILRETYLNNASNRSLVTTNPARNSELWAIAGYLSVPSVEELVSELVRGDREEEA
jgi:dTDP-4-dehydrorhamnose reductase